MPAQSEKQRRFFGLVRAVQKGDKSPHEVSPELRKAAKSISAKDAGDFARSVAELKTKKAMLSILKDCRNPLYLDEGDDTIGVNPIAKEFHVKDDFEVYVKKFIGQPFSPKELEAVNTFKEVKPSRVERTEIWYENTDDFQNSTTTVIKKMKDGTQFSFNAFTKHTTTQPEEEPEQPPMGGTEQPPMGGPEQPTEPGAAGEPIGAPAPETPETEPEQPMEEEKDDIIVSKSPLFKDEIKGGAILVELLKKLDL